MVYSRPAIEFGKHVTLGMRFLTPVQNQHWMGEQIELRRKLKPHKNPDDVLWEASDSIGRTYEVRNWWLRQYCVEVSQ